jgi:hypothetical protein
MAAARRSAQPGSGSEAGAPLLLAEGGGGSPTEKVLKKIERPLIFTALNIHPYVQSPKRKWEWKLGLCRTVYCYCTGTAPGWSVNYSNTVGNTTLHRSPIKPNRAKNPHSFRRVNHAELASPPWAKLRWLVRRIFWPKAGILVRCRSLGIKIQVRGRVRSGRYKAKHRYFTSFCWNCFGNSSGRGARIKILKELSYGNKARRTDWTCLGSQGTKS